MTDYRCIIHGTFFDGTPWSTRFHQSSASDLPTVWTNFAEAVTTMWTDATNGLQKRYPVATTVTSVAVAELDVAMHEELKQEDVLPIPGTATGDTLPIINSTVIRLNSSGVKRYTRGRMYLPAMEETMVNDNVVPEAIGLSIGIAVTTMFQSLRAAGGTIFVYNAKEILGPPLIPAFTHQTITQSECSNKPGRQSRRANKQRAVYY
jgi:hypothetical protein